MALATAAALTAGGWAAAAYLDAKYHFRKDLRSMRDLKIAEKEYVLAFKEGRLSPWYILDKRCRQYWNNRALWSREKSYTYGEFHEQIARYAQWFLEQGVQPGDLVAVYLHNIPEFMMIWFALLCIGAAPSFINYNLEGRALVHCLDVCESKLLIADEDAACQKRVEGSRIDIENMGTKIVVLDRTIKEQISAKVAIVPDDKYRRDMKPDFPFALIYTSGTTGLPKGCAYTVSRTWLLGSHIKPFFDAKPKIDCWYNSMPLYHGTGGITSAVSLLGGLTVAIAPRFSVSRFWNDIHDSGATFFIYVGETARYLLNAPPHPLERKHKLRCAYGNGLRPDVWMKLQERFNIPEVAEFFNSSEGMFSLLNWNRGPYLAACVGHHGLLYRRQLKDVYIPVRIDHETGDIWRDPKTGYAQRMPYEEGGEMLVTVPNKEAFQGYWRAQSATDKKFCTDVFKKGDLYYRTGDSLRRCPDGKWYFMDRLGDTFRWKSENVSTAEVSECLGRYPGIAEANVYGVLVPNHEGRAGCAAIHLDPNVVGSFDYNALLRYARKNLPRYAVPEFIRIVEASTHIHNHKQNKVPLRKEGVDPRLTGKEASEGKNDLFLWIPPKGDEYVSFKAKDWETLKTGQARL